MTHVPRVDEDAGPMMNSSLPEWQFSERHETTIRASRGAVIDAIAGLSKASDPLVSLLIMLRELPSHNPAGQSWPWAFWRSNPAAASD
jgi:hypothetical protein